MYTNETHITRRYNSLSIVSLCTWTLLSLECWAHLSTCQKDPIMIVEVLTVSCSIFGGIFEKRGIEELSRIWRSHFRQLHTQFYFWWDIWKQRNRRTFQNLEKSLSTATHLIKEIFSYQQNAAAFWGLACVILSKWLFIFSLLALLFGVGGIVCSSPHHPPRPPCMWFSSLPCLIIFASATLLLCFRKNNQNLTVANDLVLHVKA
jgi:hypothetical protein